MAVSPRTHLRIDPRWSGELVALDEGRARVRLRTRPEMAADAAGLVHGGFLFSLADYCAMLAVNEPNVVLASAELRFEAPTRVGESVEADGRVVGREGRRHRVEVTLTSDAGRSIASGGFECVVTPRHVLEDSD